MALPGSGPIKFSEIQTEFGGANPISLGEYYRNGAYTTSNNTSVPTSGAIQMSNFYGATAFVADVTPAAVDWINIMASDMLNGSAFASNATQTVSGINQTITLRANVPSCEANASGNTSPSFSGTFTVYVAGSQVASFTHGRTGLGQTYAAKSVDFTVSNGQTVYFLAEGSYGGFGAGSGGFSGDVSILNLSNGNAVLDTFNFSISAGIGEGGGDPL